MLFNDLLYWFRFNSEFFWKGMKHVVGPVAQSV